MTYGRMLFAFAALALASCNNTTPTGVSSSVRPAVGTFKLEAQEHFPEDVGDGKFAMVVTKEFLTIGGNSVTIRRTCRVGDDVKVVEGTAVANVNDTHFVLETPISQEIRIGKFKCAIKRGAGVWGYDVENDYLTLKAADGTVEGYGYQAGKRPSFLKNLKEKATAVGNYVNEALGRSED